MCFCSKKELHNSKITEAENHKDILLLNNQYLTVNKDKTIMNNCSFQFICLTETWCRTRDLSHYVFPGHHLVFFFCRSSFKSRGVSIWCLSSIFQGIFLLDFHNFCVEKDVEPSGSKWNDKTSKYDITIIYYYRSPSGCFDV